MRPIKFRAWDGKKMRHWGSGVISIDHQLNIETIGENKYLPKESVLMQFTGLTDKNGKEMYEGDIVNVCNAETMSVVWKSYWCAFWFDGNGSEAPIKGSFQDNYEIIGNIYENPELIK